MKKFIIQDREAGNVIEKFKTLQEAQNKLQEYEEQDKAEGIYEENFYEIVEKEEEQKMKVFVLKEIYYNYDVGLENTCNIDVFTTKEKAIEKRRKLIIDNTLNYNYIIDEDLRKKNHKNLKLITLFYDFQENWQNYIEFEIEEKEVE